MYLYKALSINTLFSKVKDNVTIVKHPINNPFVLITRHSELFKPNKLA